MDEFAFIREMLAPLAATAPGARGLGDDAATVSVSPGHELVVTADAIVAGVHFLTDDAPDLIARKALRVNLSDLAAKGARPIGFLMAISLPRGVAQSWLRKFVDGLRSDVDSFCVPLIGGDTVTTPGPLTIAITAMGEVPAGAMLTRSGARIGNLVCVSGTIGDGALGLQAARGAFADRLVPDDLAQLVERYAMPQPRLSLGLSLRQLATACLDVSDGLVADLGHLCERSGVGIEVDLARIPLSQQVSRLIAQEDTMMSAVLGGGDDYELAFTLPADREPAIRDLAAQTGIAVTVIGRVVTGDGVKVLDRAGAQVQVLQTGYRHL